MKPKLSIVIPTHKTDYNQQSFLKEVIISIIHSYGFDSSVEVIIVENPEKTQEISDLIKFCCHNREWNIIHTSSELGANKARNYGIKMAQSDVIALLDDDCVVYREWLNNVILAHQLYPEVGIIGGSMKLMFKCQKPRWIDGFFASSLAQIDFGTNNIIDCTQSRNIASGNISFKKSIYNLTSGFDETVGYVGSNCMSQDEISFIQECSLIGKPGVLYIGNITILHQIGQSRLSIDYFIKKSYGDGYNYGRMLHNNIKHKDLFIEDYVVIHGWPRWNQYLNLKELSEVRQRISHEESTRIYIRNLMKCKIAFFCGFEDYISNADIKSYEKNDTKPLFIESVSTKN